MFRRASPKSPFGISARAWSSEGEQLECGRKKKDINKTKIGERNICLLTCTYVNTPPTLVLNLPITAARHSAACFVSILIEAWLQSRRIRGNPRCLLCVIQTHLAMPWREPQITSLVEQSLHNMHRACRTGFFLYHEQKLNFVNSDLGSAFNTCQQAHVCIHVYVAPKIISGIVLQGILKGHKLPLGPKRRWNCLF